MHPFKMIRTSPLKVKCVEAVYAILRVTRYSMTELLALLISVRRKAPKLIILSIIDLVCFK